MTPWVLLYKLGVFSMKHQREKYFPLCISVLLQVLILSPCIYVCSRVDVFINYELPHNHILWVVPRAVCARGIGGLF